MRINVIGDVTGFGDTLEALVKEMPKADLWCLGDIVDRGPNSKKALDFLIDNGHRSLMGNHEHMMIFDKLRAENKAHPMLYTGGDWLRNGGMATMESFGVQWPEPFDWRKFPKYFKFMESLPLKYEADNLILTHAPINNKKDPHLFDMKHINNDFYYLTRSILWNRLPPSKIEGKFQVYGHQSTKGILCHTDKYPQGIYMADKQEIPHDCWGMCIDTWREGYLTGLHIDTNMLDRPSMAIQVFIKHITDPFDFGTPKKKRMKGIYEF